MRSPERVLNSLNEHSKDSSYKFERLYRILFNEELFYVAYQKIASNGGSTTKGSDGRSIDEMSLARIETLIASLKDESYQPHPSRRVHIPKKNGKTRPLGIPAFEDKLVQEVVRMILEAIYEGHFETTSHGFRPKRSCHTALLHIQKTFSGAKWFIEGPFYPSDTEIPESGIRRGLDVSQHLQRNAAGRYRQPDSGEYIPR